LHPPARTSCPVARPLVGRAQLSYGRTVRLTSPADNIHASRFPATQIFAENRELLPAIAPFAGGATIPLILYS